MRNVFINRNALCETHLLTSYYPEAETQTCAFFCERFAKKCCNEMPKVICQSRKKN